MMDIPHITSNIIPLSNVIKYHTNETYNLLSTAIENLSITKGKESDLIRRKNLLNLIISIRQDFLKIYTLVKWSSKSKDIGKLIDLLNWFREQESYFDNLSFRLNELNSFSGAKLPNSDLITSLEVIIKGRPQLPSYNLLHTEDISNEKILKVLKDLNLCLTTRIALSDNIPIDVMKNYQIKDGRIIFTMIKNYQVSITVGNDEIIEDDKDYYKSPYFFIDFKFLFGENFEQNQIDVPKTLWNKLEQSCNQILLKDNIEGLYNHLNNITKNFKYELIMKQLKNLDNLKWKHLKHKYTDRITINYWGSSNSIEVSINTNLAIEFKWFKNGEEMDNSLLKKDSYEDSFDIEALLTSILYKHSEIIIDEIFKQCELKDLNFLKRISSNQILIKDHKCILSIDYLIGKFYTIEPNSLEIGFLDKINRFNYNNDENNWIEMIIKCLVDLKLELIAKDLSSKLITIEWITNKIIKLKDSEISKLGGGDFFKIRYFRYKNWPSSWFLMTLIDDKFKVKWFVSRIKSIRGDWRLEWISPLDLKDLNEDVKDFDTNFEFFNTLSDCCTSKIINNMIIEELNVKKVEYIDYKPSNHKLNQYLNDGMIITIFNNDDYLPVQNCSNSIFLKIKLGNNETKNKVIELKLISELKFDGDINKIKLPNIKIEDDHFEIFEVIDLDFNINNNLKQGNIFTRIFKILNKFNHLIKLLNELTTNNIKILEFSNIIKIRVNDVFDELIIELPSDEDKDNDNNYKLKFDKQTNCKILIDFINKSINNHKLIGIINYLNLITPIITSIDNLKASINKRFFHTLNNGLHKLYVNTKFYNLNNFELLFNINSINPQNNKKILRSKIVLNVKFKLNNFKTSNKLDLTVSLIDNLNIKNIKYKKLFELIYKTLKDDKDIINLNYDFIIDNRLFDKFLQDVGKCFINYIENES